MKKKTIDTSLIDRAIIFATKAHEGVVRKGTVVPYIVHPMEALSIAATLTDDQELLAAAVLHDVVEDAGVSIETLRQEFGQHVADLVDAETDREVSGMSHIDSWQKRKQSAIDRFTNASEDVLIVAISDKLSNMRAMARNYNQIGDALWQRFNQTDPSCHAWYYYQLAERLAPLSHTDAYQEFAALVDQVFKKYRPAG